MKLYLVGIKSYQLDLGIDCTAFRDPRLERTIQGIKRDHNEPECRIRSPLLRPQLLTLLCHLQGSDYDKVTLRAAFSLAFAAFLRVGEFTYMESDKQLGSSFSKWFLTKSSIQVACNDSHMELTIPVSKTDPFRKGVTVTIAATQDEGCPVRAIRQLWASDTHRPPEAPLFCIGKYKQQAFTREHVVQRLQHLASLTGLSKGKWNGHSFRRGAATWASQVGITEPEIQTLGRWRSDAYKAYIEYTSQERIALSQRFQHNRVVARVPR